ncbi:MAG: DUF4367 domain-containing protein [Christensenellales bacterium]|jgi:hypothetical protein
MNKKINEKLDNTIRFNGNKQVHNNTDVLLTEALFKYQEKQDNAWQAEYDALPTDNPKKIQEADFFKETEANTLKLIKKHERRYKKTNKNKPSFLKFATAVLATLLLTMATALAFFPESRKVLFKLLYKTTPQYTNLEFVPQFNLEDVPKEWKGDYYPAYIPQEYSFYEAKKTEHISRIVFKADDEHYMSYGEFIGFDDVNVDSEGKTVEEADINGLKGAVSYGRGNSIVVWKSLDRMFIVTISADKDTALAIARSVIRIK